MATKKNNNLDAEAHKHEIIKEIPMDAQSKANMQRYALYVTRNRVTSDFRDGLIPVQRRIIYTMFENSNLRRSSQRVKSAEVVGATMGHYHPHGDAAIYNAMKPMVNWFEIKVPLINKTGNFGNLQGDIASASRYTEVGLSKFTLDVVLSELIETRQSVDWLKNYNDKELEPEYLPIKVPLLLINGSFGIGVGMRPEIPSHNMIEVIDVTLRLMDDPNAYFVLIPDHCMPCEIIDTDWRKINNGELSNYVVRSKIDIVDLPNGMQELVMRSIPDLTFLKSIDEAIDALILHNELPQISEIEDRSTDYECEYHIHLKRGADPIFVRDTIWKKTAAMKTCRVNLETLVDGVPQAMTYREYLLSFIEHRKLIKSRLYANKLQDYDTRIHEKEVYIKILESNEIDQVISMIKSRKSTDDTELIEFLIKKYKITDLQASYISNAGLKMLSVGYLNKFKEERDRLVELRKDAYNKIVHDELLVQEIKDELMQIKAKYGRPRNCAVVNASVNDIPAGMFNIVINTNNFIKKIPINDQVKPARNEVIRTVIQAENRESILIFDKMGKVFKLPVSKIPLTDRSGIDIRFLIKNLTSDINTIIYEPDVVKFNDKQSKYFLVVVTAQGNIKKMDLADFTTVPPSGILYTKLDQGDEVSVILIINDGFDILCCAGKSGIRIPVKDIPHLKRNTKGSRVMITKHTIESISLVKPNSEYIVVVTRNGFINKISAVALPTKQRGKSGNQIIKLSKTDSILTAYGVTDKDRLMVYTQSGQSIPVNVADLPMGSSIGEGARVINKGDNICNCILMQ